MAKAAKTVKVVPDVGKRLVQIPSISDVLILDEPWTFRLFYEYRNETLLAVFGKKFAHKADRDAHEVVTLPVGTELRVDRIYIRKGVKDYDSLTFLAKGLRKEKTKLPKVPKRPEMKHDLGPQPAYLWNDTSAKRKKYDEWQQAYRALWTKFEQTPEWKAYRAAVNARDEARRLVRPVRFWAKLADVNTMVVRSAAWTEREAANADLSRSARLIELEDD